MANETVRHKRGLVFYRDSNTVMILLMCKIPLITYEREQQAMGEIVWFGFNEAEAEPIVSKFDRNEPIPLPDARNYILANTLFKTILYERRGM